MQKTILILVAFIFFVPDFLSAADDPKSPFNDGIRFYSEGRYEQALENWLGLIDSGYSSADLHYNIGNAAFKSGKIAESILYYEKALLQRPFDEDIRYNLEIVRTFTIDSFDTIPELFLVRWFRMISLTGTSNFWAVLSFILFTLSLLNILIYLFSSSDIIKKSTFFIALWLISFSLFSLGLSFQNRSVTVFNRKAIIFSPAVTGKSSPGNSGKDLFVIHEGTRVEVEDEVGGWYEIRLSDGNVGWIQVSDAEKI